MIKTVNIIGAGLSGCEAAYQLSKRGINVNLFEVKKIKKNPVQKLDYFAELVCSNTLRSTQLENAVGTLKEEMKMLDSLVIKAALNSSIPAGGSLAVDRELFSKYITNTLESLENVSIKNEEVTHIDRDKYTIICSGPLTTENLQKEIEKLIGKDYFFFYDAVAPIVSKDSINMDIAYYKNRYDKHNSKDYINCPMSKEQYEDFWRALVNAETIDNHLEEEKDLSFFEGCMPVEAMAKRGIQTLTFGPLKPAGLNREGYEKNYACVQLRQDDAANSLYNMVGFQTNLKWSEQKKVFSMIPGLENAEFVRYGVMHKNNYINTPSVLNKSMNLLNNEKIFFAGQITGVEGYVESAASGIVAAINCFQKIKSKNEIIFPTSTVIGSLINYITTASKDNFQPMKAVWGIVRQIDSNLKINKKDKKVYYSNRSLNDLRDFINKFLNK